MFLNPAFASRLILFSYELKGTATDYEHAAKAYLRAVSLSNAQAMFNLGYMHEHGQGLPLSLHLAKRFYHKALETDPAAKYAVALALTSLWIRKNFAHSFLVRLHDYAYTFISPTSSQLNFQFHIYLEIMKSTLLFALQ